MVLIPLGTTAGKPLHARHLPSVALVINGRIVLFDCGEATQFQLLQARLRTSRIDTICITHLHGDHYYGLPGLISTMALDNRQRSLTIIGPSQLHAILDKLPGTRPSERGFDIQFVRIERRQLRSGIDDRSICDQCATIGSSHSYIWLSPAIGPEPSATGWDACAVPSESRNPLNSRHSSRGMAVNHHQWKDHSSEGGTRPP